MTVSNTTNEVSYTGPQPAALPFTFRILQDSDLTVTQIALDGTISTLVLTMDYTVQGALSYTGGTVTLTAGALATGVQIVITRTPGEVQDTSLQSQAAYDAKTVENALDLLTMICQWLQNQVSRALIVPPGTTPITLPDPLALALLQWNAGATGLQNIAIADLGTILAAGNYIADFPAFTAGSTTALTLSQAPGAVNNAFVYFDGAYQQSATYTVSGVTLTLSSPVPFGVKSVEVRQAGVLPINTPADNSVATATLQNLAVTGPKIAAATISGDKVVAATLTQDLLAANVLQAGKNGIINGSAIVAQRVDYAASVTGTYGYGKGDRCKGALTGGTSVSGTLTQVANSSAGITGCAFRWSAVTLAGTGCTVKYRFYIEAKDALRYKNGTATFSAKAYHNVGSAINYTITASKATVADDFSSVTTIQAGSAQSVPNTTNTAIYLRAISMGDCSNGIQVDIVASSGAVASKLFDLTDCQFEPGSTETAIEIRPIGVEAALCARYFQATVGVSTTTYAWGWAYSTTNGQVFLPLAVTMRAVPTLGANTTAAGSLQVSDGLNVTILTGRSITAGSSNPSLARIEFTAASGLTAFRPVFLNQNGIAAYRIELEADF